jgi:hypothetical protein
MKCDFEKRGAYGIVPVPFVGYQTSPK